MACNRSLDRPMKKRWSGDGRTLLCPSNMPLCRRALSSWKTLWSLSSRSPRPDRPASTCLLAQDGKTAAAVRHAMLSNRKWRDDGEGEPACAGADPQPTHGCPTTKVRLKVAG